jgi:putative membrane protein
MEVRPTAGSIGWGRLMMYGQVFGWGWLWFAGIVLILILAVLIVLVVRAFSGGTSSGTSDVPPVAVSSARQIAEERLARGEISPDEFRQIARALDDRT